MSEVRWTSAISGWKTTIASLAVLVVGVVNAFGFDVPVLGATELVDQAGGVALSIVGTVFFVLRFVTDSKSRLREWTSKD